MGIGSVDVPEFMTPELEHRLDNRSFARNMSAGGLRYHVNPQTGVSRLSADPRRTERVHQLADSHNRAAGGYRKLREDNYAPGYSKMREAGLKQLDTAFAKKSSDLRSEFARRNVAGSSFASDAHSRLAAEEAQTRTNFTAETYLKEVAVSQELMKMENQHRLSHWTTYIEEWDKRANLGSQLYQHTNQMLMKISEMFTEVAIAQGNAETQAQIAEMQAKAQLASAGIGAGASLLGGLL